MSLSTIETVTTRQCLFISLDVIVLVFTSLDHESRTETLPVSKAKGPEHHTIPPPSEKLTEIFLLFKKTSPTLVGAYSPLDDACFMQVHCT